MKHILLFLILVLPLSVSANRYSLKSPDGKIEMTVSADKQIRYSVSVNGYRFLEPSFISFVTNGQTRITGMGIVNALETTHDEIITPVVKQKSNRIRDHYNLLRLDLQNNISLEFRAYNDGVAYRIITDGEEDSDMIVNTETVEYNFADNYELFFPEEESVYSHQEREYKQVRLSSVGPERFCSTPMLVDLEKHGKVLITESDLYSYPGMFLEGDDKNKHSLKGKFAPYPLLETEHGDRDRWVTQAADFIARTEAKRTFPWRTMVIAEQDGDLVLSEMVYKLARPLELENTSWIRPGKVAWDWLNALNIYGVDFKSGVNTDTYKYYIDFAATYGLEYVILDEGWSDTKDVTRVVPEIDMDALSAYAESKNVGLILWVLWNGLENQLDKALDLYQSWGVRGIKVDFMQRDDQKMVDYYWKVAKAAAEREMLVDYHGSYKPAGIRRAWPNVITREGVRGGEQSKWSDYLTPDHNLTLPFTRMVAGPMDYTPGHMINATEANFRDVFEKPMSQGTRCHQLSMYVLYESPLQMLCDNPSHYYDEPVTMEFLSAVPTTWDESQVLHARIGDYLVMARRNGNTWYVGGMNDWTERDFNITLDFLPEGNFTADIWKDGVNAHRYASDHVKTTAEVNNSSKVPVHMAPGGGFVMIIKKK